MLAAIVSRMLATLEAVSWCGPGGGIGRPGACFQNAVLPQLTPGSRDRRVGQDLRKPLFGHFRVGSARLDGGAAIENFHHSGTDVFAHAALELCQRDIQQSLVVRGRQSQCFGVLLRQ
jgi:hypothetical protein